MNRIVSVFHKSCYALLVLLVMFTTALFAQRTIKGKMIKTGLWKGGQIEYVADELVVIVKPGVKNEDIMPLFKKNAGQLSYEIDELGFTVVSFPDSTNVIAIAEALQNNSIIKAIEPNAIFKMLLAPNDPYFQNGTQWALYNEGQNPPGGTSGADIDIKKAWDITQGNDNIKIGVLDTGIPIVNGNLSHEDLDDSNRFLLWDDFTNEGDNSVKDEHGHGTHVAGIIGAETNNNKGIAGIASECKLGIVQVANDSGVGSEDMFYNGVKKAVDSGAKVINFSSGYPFPKESLLLAVTYANTAPHKAVIVTATGNESWEMAIFYPAAYSSSYDNVIAVSATDHDDNRADYANIGGENIYAPGGLGGLYDSNDIYSTTPNYPFDMLIQTDSTYGYMAGTSMATPHVSGVAALNYYQSTHC